MEFRVDPEQCVACLACVRVCPADAVAVDGPRVGIVDDACTRCGVCLPACPHEAISAAGDFQRSLELALEGRATLILSVESAAYFFPHTPEQVVNACYAAGFRTVHRGVLGDELVAREYLKLWAEGGWGTMIRSTCPVIVEHVRHDFPELLPYLAPVSTPIAAEARYLKAMYGAHTPVVYAGVCLTEGGSEVDAAITFEELARLFDRRGVRVADQHSYFTRLPEERRRFWSTAGGLPLEVLVEETHASARFRKVRGLGALPQLARAVAEERMDLGFVDILPCEGCLDHPLLGPHEDLFRRRRIVGATEPPRAQAPVVEDEVARVVRVEEAYEVHRNGHEPSAEALARVLEEIGTAPNGKAWDCGACGYRTCRSFAAALVRGRTTYRSCPPYLDARARDAQAQAAEDALTGIASYRVLRDRLAGEAARARRTGEPFAVLFLDLDHFKQVNDRHGHQAGNDVLRSAGAALRDMLRASDLAARYGGDEFVALLTGTNVAGAVRVAEKVRERLAELAPAGGGAEERVSASIGVAAFDPARPDRDVLAAADRALYRAKAAGRNQVIPGD